MAGYVAPPKAAKKKGGLRGKAVPNKRYAPKMHVTKKGQTMAEPSGEAY